MNNSAIKILTGDITAVSADAIVNPTDASFSASGGIDLAVHRAAGSELASALREIGRIGEGQAVITPAFNINSAGCIIHTVGPKWKTGFAGEEYALAECYRSSLRLALEQGCKSVAFPCISAGGMGFPAERAAEIAVCTVINTLQTLPEADGEPQIIFVCPEKFVELYKKQLKKAIIAAFLHYYSPESTPYHRSDKYYSYMKTLAVLQWGDMRCHRNYHGGFAKAEYRPGYSEYDLFAMNMDTWDYNTCLAYIIEIFRAPYSYDGTGLPLPHYEQFSNGTVRRVLLRMQAMLG